MLFFFFFSSRRRHTRCYRDWSSDVCSSDLWLAHSDDGFEAESFAALSRLGIPVERLAKAEVAKRWPQIGGDDLEWALFEPEGGALMAREGVAAVEIGRASCRERV